MSSSAFDVQCSKFGDGSRHRAALPQGFGRKQYWGFTILGQRAFAALAGVLLGALLSGCVTGSGRDGRDEGVALAADGTITVDGRKVTAQDLPGRLRAQGVSRSAVVRVSVPPGAPKSHMAEVHRQLVTQGFSRVVFTTPRQASAVSRAKSPKPAVAPSPPRQGPRPDAK